MHIGRHVMQELILKLGEPVVERWRFPVPSEEFSDLRKQANLGRAQEIDVLILRGDEVVLVRRPHDPAGAYRPPSGSVDPDEPLVEGAVREAREETGVDFALESYLLCAQATFTCGGEEVKWSTHVLVARSLPQAVGPLDAETAARWMRWDDLLREVNPILEKSGLVRLACRARVHKKAHELLVAAHRLGEAKA